VVEDARGGRRVEGALLDVEVGEGDAAAGAEVIVSGRSAEALTAQATDIIDAPGFVFAGTGPGGTLVEGVSGVVQGSAELAEWSCPDPDVDACEGSSRDSTMCEGSSRTSITRLGSFVSPITRSPPDRYDCFCWPITWLVTLASPGMVW